MTEKQKAFGRRRSSGVKVRDPFTGRVVERIGEWIDGEDYKLDCGRCVVPPWEDCGCQLLIYANPLLF
jgi:hypothetical protein